MHAKLNDKSFMVGMLVVGIVVTIGVAALLFKSAPQQQQEVLSATTEAPASEEITGRPALTVQTVDPGTIVRLESVELQEPGFVVISQDENREADAILGRSALLQKGFQKDVDISIALPLVDSQVIHLMLYKDNGDGSLGEGDYPVLDENGLPIEVVKNVGMLPMDHSF